MNLYENVGIGNFIHMMGFKMGCYVTTRGVSVSAAANLFQQTPADTSLADYMYTLNGRSMLIEFKRPQNHDDKEKVKVEKLKSALAQEYDDTGLYYYRARYYDPQLKRFISEDPIGIEGGLNLYAYVSGNPLGYTDSDGMKARAGEGGRPYGSGNSADRRYDRRHPPSRPNKTEPSTNDPGNSDSIIDAIENNLCAILGYGCLPEDSLVCLYAECDDQCGRTYSIDYMTDEPVMREPDKLWPPPPSGVPPECKCTIFAIRQGPAQPLPGL